MNQINYENEKYILLSDVASKCSSLAKKWNYIANQLKIENCGLENELIKRACRQQIYLYCFMFVDPDLPGLGKKWFFIWSDYLKNYSSLQSVINCNLFLVSPEDRIEFDQNYDSGPRLMGVKRSDLYLNLDELKRLEENDQDFAGLVMVGTNLVREEVENESNSGSSAESVGSLGSRQVTKPMI